MIEFFSSKTTCHPPQLTKQARSQRRRRMEAYAPLDFDGRGEQLRAASASEVGVGVFTTTAKDGDGLLGITVSIPGLRVLRIFWGCRCMMEM